MDRVPAEGMAAWCTPTYRRYSWWDYRVRDLAPVGCPAGDIARARMQQMLVRAVRADYVAWRVAKHRGLPHESDLTAEVGLLRLCRATDGDERQHRQREDRDIRDQCFIATPPPRPLPATKQKKCKALVYAAPSRDVNRGFPDRCTWHAGRLRECFTSAAVSISCARDRRRPGGPRG
jgi:hypothetical protein